MVSPCAAPGVVDAAATRRYAASLIENGCDGLFVVSSTGGAALLDETDRRTLLAAARAGMPDGAVLYAGISGLGVRHTLRLAAQAAADGADAGVMMAPYFARLSQEELLAYVLAVADASPIPVCVYHHMRMPTPFAVETLARIAGHSNVAALKDTDNDPPRLPPLLGATTPHGLPVLQGNERLILATLRAGGHGCVSALAGIAPEWHRDLLRAWRRGDEAEAQRLQDRIYALWRMFQLEATQRSYGHFAYSLAYAAHLRGWLDHPGTVVPGFKADDAFRTTLQRHLREVGLIGGVAA